MNPTGLDLRPSDAKLRQFAAALLLLSAGWGAWWLWKRGTLAPALALAGLGGATGLAGLLRPSIVLWPYRILSILTWPIGWVVSGVLLGAVYVLLITPMGLVMRLLGRDPLERKLDRKASTYWIPRRSAPGLDRYFRQF